MGIPLRYDRKYRLRVGIRGTELEFLPPLRVAFECDKSIYRGINKLTIKIFNLSEGSRRDLAKDTEDGSIVIPIKLDVGYGDKLENIYTGTVITGYSERKGAEFITTLESLDGGVDLYNSFTSKSVIGKDSSVKEIIKDFSRITEGKITEQNKLVRPKVLVGNSIRLIEEQLNEDETYFVDSEKLYILKNNDVIGTFIPVVSAETGLINQPQRANKIVTFSTMLNPTIKIGGRADLRSETAKHLNDIYRVETIKYTGDIYGSEWSQDCNCQSVQNANIL